MKATLTTILALSLFSPEGWETLKYNSIPANQVNFSKQGMKISVNSSASPIIYSFKKPVTVTQIQSQGKLLTPKGVQLKAPKKQGLKGQDDFVFRLGLVIEGKKTLSWMQRQIAASWVLRMFKLAPKNSGVDHILFLEVANNQDLVSTKRDHYLSEYLKENVVTALKADGSFHINHHFDKPTKVLGIWISSDGDDTKSRYDVLVDRIDLHRLK